MIKLVVTVNKRKSFVRASFWAGLLLGACTMALTSVASAASVCSEAFPPKRVISIEGPDIAPVQQVLRSSAEAMLRFYEKDFLLPSEIHFDDYGQAPNYRDGYINARFPFYLNFSFGTLEKTPAESLAINLHELGHQIFEVNRMQSETVRPELVWAFGTKVDMKGAELSRERIESMKAKSQFKDKPTDAIVAQFSAYSHVASAYDEFFADLIPTLFMNDPLAIYKSTHFAEVQTQGDVYERASQKSAELRRFDIDPSMAQVESEFKDDEHGAMAPTRAFIWREFQKSGLSGGAMAKVAYLAILRSMESVTRNFSRNMSDVSAAELNADLQKQISLQLSNFKLVKAQNNDNRTNR